MKTEAEVKTEIERVNIEWQKIMEIPQFRYNQDGQNWSMQYHAVVEALHWVLGEHQGINIIPKNIVDEAIAENKE
jgi:hypothetical protein